VPPVLGSVSTSRRANAFADALDEPTLPEAAAERTPTGPDAPAAPARQDALLSVARELRTLPRPELSADTKTVHRAQLVAAMETAFGGAGGDHIPEQRTARGAHPASPASALARLRPKTRLTKGLAVGGLSLGVAAGALGGAAGASTNALPGDTLYGLKRGMEDLRLDFAGGGDRGRLYLSHASTRLNEARRLMERRRAGELDEDQVAEVRRTLTSMHSDATKGHQLLSQAYRSDGSIAPLRTLSDFSEKSSGTWSELRGRLPSELRDVSADVTSLFEAIEDELGPLESLLPPDAGSRTAPGGDAAPAPQPSPGTPRQERPDTQSAPERTASGEQRPTPERDAEQSRPAEESAEEGLLGGTGLLRPAEDETEPDESGPPENGTPPRTDISDIPEPDITIPPLIDGLLPGIGLDTGTAR
jgi:hypothetical protein